MKIVVDDNVNQGEAYLISEVDEVSYDGYDVDYADPVMTGEPEEDVLKTDQLVNGFMFQAQEVEENVLPFSMYVTVKDEDQFFISGLGISTLNRDQLKTLRKQIKYVLNQEKFAYQKVEDIAQDDGPGKAYFTSLDVPGDITIETAPAEFAKSFAPWVPTPGDIDIYKAGQVNGFDLSVLTGMPEVSVSEAGVSADPIT